MSNAVTRLEQFLDAITKKDASLLPDPITREERLLHAIATGGAFPTPITSEERFLQFIHEVGVGSGDDVTTPPVVEELDLTLIEQAIIDRGGTVTKAGEKATLEELVDAVGTIYVEVEVEVPVEVEIPADLSLIEEAITNKGGAVVKASDKATIEEIISGISSIPEDDLTPIEQAIVDKGGSVSKSSEEPTVAELVDGVASIEVVISEAFTVEVLESNPVNPVIGQMWIVSGGAV